MSKKQSRKAGVSISLDVGLLGKIKEFLAKHSEYKNFSHLMESLLKEKLGEKE